MQTISKNIFTCVIATLLLAACTSTPRTYNAWYKEGVSKQTVKDQLGHCRIEVDAKNLSEAKAKKLIGYCMKSKDYYIKTFTR